MRNNWVREKIRNGQPTIGSLLGLGSPHVAELLANTDLDWLVIEMEHSAVDWVDVERILMAMSGTETIPIVRVPPADLFSIQKALDIGAMGVLVPMIKTVAEAEAMVRVTRYPPQGERGFGPLRASQYSADYKGHLEHANDNIIVILLLETKEAVEDLEAIASVPGIDVVYLGLWDLSLSLGLNPLELPLPEIDRVIERALETCGKKGIGVGMGTDNPEGLAQRQSDGFTFLGYGPEYSLILNSVRAGLEVFKRS